MKHLTDDELQTCLDNGKIADFILQHLDRCDVCRKNLNQYRSLFSELSEPHLIRLRPDFTRSIMSRIQSQNIEPKPQVWSFVLATLSLIMATGIGLYFIGFKSLSKITVGIDEFTGSLTAFVETLLGFTANLDLNFSLLAIGILSLALFSALDHIYIKSRGRSFPQRS